MLPTLRSLLAASLVALALPAAASAADITVSPGPDAKAQVDGAPAGSTIIFTPGTYATTFAPSAANLTLKGQPGAALVGPADATVPTLAFTGNSATVNDLTILSQSSNGVQFAGGDNALNRSTVASLKPTSGVAVTIAAGTLGARTLAVDSSVLVGAIALQGNRTSVLDTTAVVARHVTAIGALGAEGVPAGSPAARPTFDVSDSIVRGAVGTGVSAPDATNSVKATPADAATLFIRPAAFNYHLRADAPVIDGGSATVAAGGSATDIDGDPRVAGAKSDLGADEFVNRVPTASVAAPSGAVRQGVPATFDASKSADPEAGVGGGIVKYHWDFGDGATADTTIPTTAHAFGERKAYSVTVTVTDRQGGVSAASAPASVTVLDGTAPTVTIGQPGVKQRLNLYNPKHKTRRSKVTFFGSAADDTALSGVFLALRPVASANGQCRWFDGKSKLVTAACTAPKLLTAKVTGGSWRYVLPIKAKLPRGPYQLVAVSLDASGLVSAVKTVAFRFR
ncbi:MAG: hypothetical protein JWM73_1472 [Solirubrobacterales bacterium]|nr:hypothetical protein [Solirubrobacterales bacterium]